MAETLRSSSEDETRRIAARVAPTLHPGEVLLVSGDLGAGKTAFVRGLAEGLGLDGDQVTSPTFTLVHEYRGGRLPLIHVDLYRLDSVDLAEIGLDDDLATAGVVAVEWPERLTRGVPGAIHIRIDDAGGDERVITRHEVHED
ncbi:MAG TPA: tRNA (adenosine(37)-N6)-threonylcarbamoyltransferase complex ATPase subunit type 1 TsaE [Vicinamibacterales bacterium]|jgi:tRNA threonylcarbamoyladenosine biosynthesis protein TsaE|nr:tRNA (adenosine(37)-N6)-threonylcarbamoyltransferase complex ATPase subunit type 1 TsaE [Vicinamibacterales bacterium]